MQRIWHRPQCKDCWMNKDYVLQPTSKISTIFNLIFFRIKRNPIFDICTYNFLFSIILDWIDLGPDYPGQRDRSLGTHGNSYFLSEYNLLLIFCFDLFNFWLIKYVNYTFIILTNESDILITTLIFGILFGTDYWVESSWASWVKSKVTGWRQRARHLFE